MIVSLLVKSQESKVWQGCGGLSNRSDPRHRKNSLMGTHIAHESLQPQFTNADNPANAGRQNRTVQRCDGVLLVRIASQDHKDGLEQDLYIHPNRPVAYISVV